MSWHTSDGRVAGVFIWNCSAWSAWGPSACRWARWLGQACTNFFLGVMDSHGLDPPPPSPSLAPFGGACGCPGIAGHFASFRCVFVSAWSVRDQENAPRRLRLCVRGCVLACACSRVRGRMRTLGGLASLREVGAYVHARPVEQSGALRMIRWSAVFHQSLPGGPLQCSSGGPPHLRRPGDGR